jgi:colanic acid biosynthesis glycosyl transferase WcaI
MTSLRILLLVNQFPPDLNPSGKLMHQLAVGLVKRGHQVQVITAFPHYSGFRIAEEYRGRLVMRSLEDGLRVTRVWVFASGQKQRMWHRLTNYLTYNAAAFLAAQAGDEFDVVLAPNGSFFTGVTAAALGLLRHTRFVYNVQDIYPDVPARAGQLKGSLQVRGLQLIERAMYRAATQVTVISDAQRANLLAKGVPPERVTVIPNFVDTSRVQPESADSAMARRFGWENKFVVVHSGNIGFAYDFDTLLEAAQRLHDHKDILFVIIGEGVRLAELKRKAEQMALGNVQFLPFQPEADLPRLRATADLQLSLYRRGSSELSLPSKLYEIMASGRPLVASAEAGSDVAQLVERAGAGIVVEPEQPERVVDAVLLLSRDEQRRALLSTQGRRYACEHHSLENAVEAYERLLTNVAGQH